MDKVTAEMILGLRDVPQGQETLIGILRQHLSVDNNKLREDVVLSYLGYIPSFMGSGHPDGHKPDGTFVDNKSGPNIIFPDGGDSIQKKRDWVCVVSEFSQSGQLLYIAEVLVSDIWDDLLNDKDHQIFENGKKRDEGHKGSLRVSPKCVYNVWLTKPNTRVVYTNSEAFPKTSKGEYSAPYNKIYESYKNGLSDQKEKIQDLVDNLKEDYREYSEDVITKSSKEKWIKNLISKYLNNFGFLRK